MVDSEIWLGYGKSPGRCFQETAVQPDTLTTLLFDRQLAWPTSDELKAAGLGRGNQNAFAKLRQAKRRLQVVLLPRHESRQKT